MIHKAVNVTTTEAKLFAIWCGINQVVGITSVNCIVVIMDSLHAAKKIFDSSLHSFQIHSAAISHELRDFFSKDVNNCIKFWNCPSKQKWPLYTLVDKDSKRFLTLSLSSHVNYLGISVKSGNIILFSYSGKYLFKWQILKEEIFWNYWTTTSTLLNCRLLKAVLGYNISAILTHCAPEPLEPLSIMLPLVNII